MTGAILVLLSMVVTGGDDVQVGRQPAATFFVATNGNDAWSGKLAAPNGQKTDGPFATLGRARNALREVKTKQSGPLTIMVRGGKYFLSETLVLGGQDGGTRECPITYTAYPGEKPILSGGQRVTGWKPYQGKILQCDLPGVKGGKWKFRRLFLAGKPQIRARTPNFDPDNPISGGWATLEGPAEPESQVAFRYKPGTFQHRWAKPSEGEVNIYFGHDWGNNIIPIKRIDEQKRIITLVRGTSNFDRPSWFEPTPFQPNQRFVVENLLEELDQPGEWCLDSEEGKLYFWPPRGSIEQAEVVAPAVNCLIALDRASHITIRGFTFTETTGGDNLHPDSVEGLGAMLPMQGRKYCGQALLLKRAEHCLVEDNHFYAVGGNAIYLQGFNARNVIRRNEVGYAGANGICLGGAWGHGGAWDSTGKWIASPRITLVDSRLQYPFFNEIVENHVHNCGQINFYTAGIFVALSEGNVIGHNLIHDVSHHGINLGNSGLSRNIVEYNDIRRTSLRTSDTGAINCWADAQFRNAPRQGHIIRYNFIADSRGKGIYVDDYTSNCFIYGNIIVRPATIGINIHGGKNNVLENNVIVGAQYAVAYTDSVSDRTPHMAGYSRGNRFCYNIVSDCKANVLHPGTRWTDRAVAQSDYNLLFNAADGDSYLESRRQAGFEAHSLVADPLFVDPQHDDYRLKPESPAFKLGFQAINLAKIGPPSMK